MDGTTYWNIGNTEPVDFHNVKMYAGDEYYNPVDGKIRKFYVETKKNRSENNSPQKDKIYDVL